MAYAFYCKNESNKVTRSDKRLKCVLVCGPSNKSVDVVLGKLYVQLVYSDANSAAIVVNILTYM